jgi:ribosomal protein S18 acetylase RimI-like enzyme
MNPDVESIERATLDAFPPLAMEEIPAWLLGLDPGKVGRAHSAAPLLHTAPDSAAVAAIEARYAAFRLSPVFRIPIDNRFEGVRDELTERGFVATQATQVQVGTARAMAQLPGSLIAGASLILTAAPDEAWVSVFLSEGFDPVDGASRTQILARARQAVFATVYVEGLAVAAGAASFSHGWASVHGMRTVPGHTGLGLASRILCAFAGEAQARGFEPVFLQVEAANTRARLLYGRAGFSMAWTYEYWRKPAR